MALAMLAGRTVNGHHMAEVPLFHHAHGLTSGVRDFADTLRSGHTVHAPDLWEGRVFDTLEEGVAYAGGGRIRLDH